MEVKTQSKCREEGEEWNTEDHKTLRKASNRQDGTKTKREKQPKGNRNNTESRRKLPKETPKKTTYNLLLLRDLGDDTAFVRQDRRL